jgi:beta-galactosidase
MKIKAYHKSLEQLHVCCEAPRAYFIPFESKESSLKPREASPYFKSLCGEWRFKFLESFEDFRDEFANKDYDCSECDNIEVPKSWQMYTDRNYDKPMYSNLEYPFPTDPPHVPDKNPCGIYFKDFELSEAFAGRKLFLNFEGVDSAFYVWLNGGFVGYSQVSHSTSEFDIGRFVKAGKNRITVLVVKWSTGTYLEDQDCFRFSGIFREVYILARSPVRLRDIHIKPIVNPELTYAEIKIEALLSQKTAVSVELVSPEGTDIGSWVFNESRFSIPVENPVLWNDENPSLYKLFVAVGDEVILFRLALRRFEIKDSVILLNGRKAKARGINRHDSHPELGHAVPYEHMKNDLHLLKRANCNAIRTSHYPNDPRFLELCDEMGFMVVDEADLETHGMGFEYPGAWDWTRWSFLSQSPEWRESYVDRAARLYERDKNHGCVIMWSLGNESGVGANHRAMAEYIRGRDSDALIHYENSHLEFKSVPEGENYADISDVESRMYPDADYIKKYLENSAYKKPFYMCEYVCSMSTGDVYDYWELVEQYDNFFGGCIWEFCDHAVNVPDENGKPRYYYGGDFGDYPNDGICCLDGLVYPDRTPRPGYYDMKRVYQQYKADYNGSGCITIKSRRKFESLSDISLLWRVECNGKTVLSGSIASLCIEPMQSREYKLFDGEDAELFGECYLTLSFTLNCDKPWAEKGYETGFEQFRIETKSTTSKPLKCEALTVSEREGYISVACGNAQYRFDKAYGRLDSIKLCGSELITEPVKFRLWRAPNYNRGSLDRWKQERIDHIVQKTYGTSVTEQNESRVIITTWISLSGPSAPPILRARVEYIFGTDASVCIVVNGTVRENAPPLPRIGLELKMQKGSEEIEYFGRGPFESYVDRHMATRFGLYQLNVADNFEHYIRPQENSSHYQTKWGYVGNDNGTGLFFRGEGIDSFCFNASHFSAEQLTDTAHDFELTPLSETVVNLDWRINAISEESIIASRHPERILDDKSFTFGFKILPAGKKDIDSFGF